MGRIWAVARQTIAEGIRMRIALVFIAILVVLLIGLPFSLRNEDSVSSATQTFLSFSLGGLEFVLALLSIFLSRSLSEEVVGGQILMLMTKPIPRWQFVVGKWLGIVTLNFGLLAMSGVGIYGVARTMASVGDPDELDRERLDNEVLTARHTIACKVPDFTPEAERQFRERLENGGYRDSIPKGASRLDSATEAAEILRFRQDLEVRWRTIFPLEGRVFEFENIRCDRSPDRRIQIRYEAEVWSYPPDEILRCEFLAGNPDLGTPLYRLPRRDVIGRFHTISVPADAVAPDRTLRVQLINRNPFQGEPQFGNTISFSTMDNLQVLFQVGSFGGNLFRQLTLVMCKLLFLAAFALMTTCILSFPVACLVSFSFLVMASMSGFLTEAVSFFDDEGAYGLFKTVVQGLYQILFFLVPDFSQYDGASLLVNGRNVTLMWVLSGLLNLVLLGTTGILVLACILFQRREVAETSI